MQINIYRDSDIRAQICIIRAQIWSGRLYSSRAYFRQIYSRITYNYFFLDYWKMIYLLVNKDGKKGTKRQIILYRQTNAYVDGWIDEWIDRQIDGQMDG